MALLLPSVLCLVLLHPIVHAFRVEITQADIPGLEGDQLDVTVRLEGQIFGTVGIQLHLLTLSQFQSRPEAPSGYTLSEDPAESGDFSHDGDLQHTFHAANVVRQITTLNIDIVDDSINENVEQFIVLVTVTNIQNEEEDFYEPGDNDQIFATVTIQIDPNAPDRTRLRVSAPSGGSQTVTEGATGLSLSLMIESFTPEHDIAVTVTAEGTSTQPAMLGSDYTLSATTVTLTPSVTEYSVTVDIVNDEIPEPEHEEFQVSFSVSGDIVSFLPSSFITITVDDNDRLTAGFSSSELEIREGESAVASFSIMSPAVVGVSLSGDVAHTTGQTTTAADDEIPDSMPFSLSNSNKEFTFTVTIPPNDDITGPEREFTLTAVDIESMTELIHISPQYLRIIIKDNDTDVNIGIRDVSATKMVMEGGSFELTVGFIDDTVELDADFVVGYSVKIIGNGPDVGTNFVTAETIDGLLTRDTRTKDILIQTKSNEEVEQNREFSIVMELTTDYHPESLVKIQEDARVLRVIIEDDDINPPIQPTVSTASVADVGDGKGFEISWTKNSSRVHPVDSYRVEVTFPAQRNTPEFPLQRNLTSTTTFLIVSYKQNGEDYTTENITVVVCAINPVGETCSEKVFHKGTVTLVGGGGGSHDGGGLSGGGAAAIAIIVIILFTVLLIFLIFLLFFGRSAIWKNYLPYRRELTDGENFDRAREEFGTDI